MWVANVAHRDALSRLIVRVVKRAYNPLVKARGHAMSLEELRCLAILRVVTQAQINLVHHRDPAA